jgi:hypothetical protein
VANKVIFICADPKHQLYVSARYEYTQEHSGLNKAQLCLDHDLAKGNKAVVVWFDNGPNPFLSSLNTGQIYIRGHGMPGYISIETARGGEHVHYTDVVQRLIVSGLKREFSGQIKCYNCHSAESAAVPDNNVDAELGGDPFAQYVADELHARGFKYCTIWGYTDAIDSFPTTSDKKAHPGEQLHKYRRGPGGIGNFGRARTGKVQFFPRVKKPGLLTRLLKKMF